MPRGRRRDRRPRPNPAAGRRSTSKTVTIQDVDDLQAKNQEMNNTDDYVTTQHLVLRRGNSFEFIVKVSSTSDLDVNNVSFEFHRGYRARYARGTMFQATCSKKSKRHYQWDMKVLNQGSDTIHFSITIPVDTPIGGYRGYLRIPAGKNKYDAVWELTKDIVIIFNPWCKEDDVYLEDDDKKHEYVLNETGLIWAGTSRNTFTWPWNFAQFETVSLEAALFMMDLWNLGSDGRRSPITVSRCMAEMVNRNDNDGGILTGLWSANEDDYKDGTDPTSWSGSEAILREYVTTKKPVKYAQCWVFGGTLTTVLRTLGIPSRPVTNFDSAHDAEFNRAIDYYFDVNHNFLSDESSDSIWNYHVWCEGWMTRPDLEGNFGGWQALDATPQELSPHSKTMVVGPASVQAIKDGLDLKYDNEFVIAEVNADVKHHRMNKKGKYVVIGSDTTSVGTKISTKAVGSNRHENIVGEYKYREGSAAERAALKGEEKESTDPFEFGAVVASESTFGAPLTFVVTVKSNQSTKASLKVTGIIEQVTYTGIVGKEIKKLTRTYNGKINPGSPQKLIFKIDYKDYESSLGEQGTLMATFLAHDEDLDISWVSRLPVNLTLPSLDISINKKGKTDVDLKELKTVQATASFINPLNTSLNDVVFFVEGAGLLTAMEVKAGVVGAKGKCSVDFKVTPRGYSARRPSRNHVTLIVTAKSRQLKGMMGTATINIVE